MLFLVEGDVFIYVSFCYLVCVLCELDGDVCIEIVFGVILFNVVCVWL